MQKIISGLLFLVGLTQLFPLIGVMGPDRLNSLYGVTINEPNLLILMRHRAVLFGLLGSFLIISAFKPQLQPLAFGAGFVSIISFIVITWLEGSANQKIRSLVMVDVEALAGLVLAIILFLYARTQN